MQSNRDQFAHRGDDWGVMRPVQHQHAFRLRRHPDGFIETVFYEDHDADAGRLDYVKPVVTHKVGVDVGQARRAFNREQRMFKDLHKR